MKGSIVSMIIACLCVLSCAGSDFKGEHSVNSGVDGTREMHYTCRLPDGNIIVSTDSAVAESPSSKKAKVFIEKSKYKPIELSGLDPGKAASGQSKDLKSLEEVLTEKLSVLVNNWKLDSQKTVKVEADYQSDVPEPERIIRLARVKTLPKKQRYYRETFEQLTGTDPVVGKPVNLEPALAGKVASINGNEVLVTFEPASDQPVEGPFGPVTVKDNGDHYIIEIQVQKDRLVRVGPLVGRIDEVNLSMFSIDYGHPFGGRPLVCDVKVETAHSDRPRLITEQLHRGPSPLPQKDTTSAASTLSVPQSGISGKTSAALPAEDALARVETGDLVEVAYTASLETGEVIRTTRAVVANDPKEKKVDGYRAQETFNPEMILVGEKTSFPGLDDAVLDLGVGERKQLTLPAEKTFGQRNPQLMRQFDRKKTIPKQVILPAQEYVKRFGGFPVKGKTVAYNPYTTGRVTGVTEKDVTLELEPLRKTENTEFGSTRIQVIDDLIHITLIPKMGAPFEVNGKRGIIVAADDKRFTVDYNHPLAGKNIVFDIKVVSLTKAADFTGKEIHWIEGYDEGLTEAEKLNKPSVLVLYADWCAFCKKLFSTTLVDPRIRMMKDDFVWVKVNSDKQKEYKALYGQKGFPMTVLLDAHGEVIGSIKGFRPANEFQAELKKAINGSGAGPKLKAAHQMNKGT